MREHVPHAVHEPVQDREARRQLLARLPSERLDEPTRVVAEAAFGFDLRHLRIHADRPATESPAESPAEPAAEPAAESAAESAAAVQARAYTFGEHVVFGRGQYEPGTPRGHRLLMHELAHVAQQRQLSEPIVQCDSDPAALRERLQQVRARRARLEALADRSTADFSGSLADERQRESLRHGDRLLRQHKAQARSDLAARELYGGTVTADRLKRVVTATQSGSTVTLSAGIQLRYAGVTEEMARKRADKDIPRITAAISRVWQVSITSGEYAGIDFRLVPAVTHLAPGAKRDEGAFLIAVRTPDNKPSAGEPARGEISIAPVHLEGERITVVAHELAHLFGFTDKYFIIKRKNKQGKPVEQFVVGRDDPQGRPDLLGMVDPVLLDRKVKAGSVRPEQAARQKKPVTVWEEEASLVLKTLGVLPPSGRPSPGPDSDDFDPKVELERERREGERRLAPIRERRRRAEDSLKWLDTVEEIQKLKQEEEDLLRRLGGSG